MRDIRVVLLGDGEAVYDEVGNETIVPVRTEVYACEESVGQNEFFRAGQSGLVPDRRLTVWSFEYGGERTVEIDGEQFAIYRTFDRQDERTELYLTKRVGDGHGV